MPKKVHRMKKYAITALLLPLLLSTGCDFLRTVAGRPTSADIAAMRRELAEEEARRREQDSLAAIEAAAAAAAAAVREDYVPIMDSLVRRGVPVYTGTKMKGVSGEGLENRYYIVTGFFKDSGNASRSSARYSEKGYNSCVIHFGSGYDGVSAGAFDRLLEADAARKEGISAGDFPRDTWILVMD